MENKREPGRILDSEIAEKVMGLPGPDGLMGYPKYSTDIAAAWQVVEKLRKKQEVTIVVGRVGYYVSLYGNFEQVNGDTAPHAICLAALKTIESK